MIDEAESKAEESEREAYAVRSAAEEGRRRVMEVTREVLERELGELDSRQVEGGPLNSSGTKQPAQDPRAPQRVDKKEDRSGLATVFSASAAQLEASRVALLRKLEAGAASSVAGAAAVVGPVQTLAAYAAALVRGHADLRAALRRHERDRGQGAAEDQARLDELRDAVDGRGRELEEAERRHAAALEECRKGQDAARRRAEELESQLEAQRMEFSMYQNSTKAKLGELQQHKKVLKREVIELRKKIDECGSESHTVVHEYSKVQSELNSFKDRNSTLERYIERLEKQVGVQQNMMEMVSQTGGASFVGKMVGPGVTGHPPESDGASLGGMSMGSQGFRRLNASPSNMSLSYGGGLQPSFSNMSIGGGGGGGGPTDREGRTTKSRQLLPPDLRRGGGTPGRPTAQNAIPIVAPGLPGGGTVGREASRRERADAERDRDEDCRDPSTAYERSDPTMGTGDASGPMGSGSDGAAASPEGLQTPHKTVGDNDRGPLGKDVTQSSRSSSAEGTGTPVQSNNSYVDHESFCNKVAHGLRDGSDKLKNIPSLDTNGENILNVNDSTENLASLRSHDPAGDPDPARRGDFPRDGSQEDEDDLDDNASRVSDITEDRTQRQIDDDLAERRKILLAYVNKTQRGGDTVPGSTVHDRRQLETIDSIVPSLGVAAADATGPGGGSVGRGRRGRMSVAQRARLAAEQGSNTHRSLSPKARTAGDAASGDVALEKAVPRIDGTARVPSTAQRWPPGAVRKAPSSDSSSTGEATAPSRGENLSRSGSFWSRMGTAIEKAVDNSVLGVPSDNEAGDHDTDEESGSYVAGSDVLSSVVSESSVSAASRGPGHTPGSPSPPPLSLSLSSSPCFIPLRPAVVANYSFSHTAGKRTDRPLSPIGSPYSGSDKWHSLRIGG